MINKYIIISVILISLLLVFYYFFSKYNNNRVEYKEDLKYNYVLGGPSKCFDCERSLPNELKWMSAPTKCFDCEKQMLRPEFSHPVKTFSAEGGLLEISKN